MEKTTSKKLARARILEQQAAAAAERKARERQNAENLTEFVVATAKSEDVDAWLAERIEKAKEVAEARRNSHLVAAGKALQAMRFRGETVTGIAAQAGITPAKVREYLKLATSDKDNAPEPARGDDVSQAREPVPNQTSDESSGQPLAPVAVGAQ